MAVTHHATIRNSLATVVLDAIDQDAGAGDLVFKTSGAAVVATLQLTDPCGTVTGETLNFDTISPDTNANAGTIDNFVIEDNSGDEILYGSVTVTSGGGDIELTSVVIDAGDTISMTTLSYTAAP